MEVAGGEGGAAVRRAGELGRQLRGGGGDAPLPGAEAPPALPRAATGGQHSVALPEALADDAPWVVRRNARCPQRLVQRYSPPRGHVATLHDNFEASALEFAERPFLGRRGLAKDGQGPGPFEWMTYGEAAALRTLLGSGLLTRGVPAKSHVGLFSTNCPEWMLADLALHAYGMVAVPLYDTLGPDAVGYIARHAGLRAIFCSTATLPTLIRSTGGGDGCPDLKLVIVYGTQGELPLGPPPPGAGFQIIHFNDLADAGRAAPQPHCPPDAGDMFTICYTSGTTGVPKGAMLTHRNVIANLAGTEHILGITSEDVHISYLPLAHIYERANVTFMTYRGAAIGFYRGEILELVDDILELKPTTFCSVPRLLNRIYDKVQAGLLESGPVARWLFAQAQATKLQAIASGDASGGTMGSVWERLVFSKIQARLGGRVRFIGTGSSPISPEVFNFLRCAFPEVHEGYGMTETCCMITMTDHEDPVIGHVGAPVFSCELKLVDVPEMGYTNADQPYPRGEICVRGPTVFQGYYRDEAQTRECLDAEGWFHTGDVGAWIEGGRLKIIDRKKNIFKLAQGEYVAPEKIENVYTRSPFIAQIFVYGDSLQAELIAIVVLDPDHVLPWAEAHGLAGHSLEELCAHPDVSAAVFDSMQREAKATKLRGFENVKAIHLEHDPWTVDNGMFTPTFKLKRPRAKEHYQIDIQRLYQGLHP